MAGHTPLWREGLDGHAEVVTDVISADDLLTDAVEHETNVEEEAESHRKQQAWNVERTQKLNYNPRGARQRTRAELEQCHSLRRPHRLGSLHGTWH